MSTFSNATEINPWNGPGAPPGSVGMPGPMGPQGPEGQPGKQGPPGPKGDQGSPGSQGPQGPGGSAGPQGQEGPRGPAGQNGTNGQNGVTPNIQVGSVTTGAPGSFVTVVRRPSSADSNPVFDFTIPRGNTGGPGEQGATGPEGPQGNTGRGVMSIMNSFMVTSALIQPTVGPSPPWNPIMDQEARKLNSVDKYLWRWQQTTFNDASIENAIHLISIYGSGRGVIAIEQLFCATNTHDPPAVDDPIWTSDHPILHADLRFLWTRIHTVFSDDYEETSVQLLAVRGKDGAAISIGSSFPTYAAFQAANLIGVPGEAHLILSSPITIVIWKSDTQEWTAPLDWQGIQGEGVKSSVVEYAITTFPSTPPTTGWSTTFPTTPPSPGQFLWSRLTITYTDNLNMSTGIVSNPSVVYGVSTEGPQGEQGPQGPAGPLGYFGMELRSDGHLWLRLIDPGLSNPMFINSAGHLILRIA